MGLDELIGDNEPEEAKLSTNKDPEDITLDRQGWRLVLAMEVDRRGISAELMRHSDEDGVKALIQLLDRELESSTPFGFGEVPQEIEDAREQLMALIEESDEKWGSEI